MQLLKLQIIYCFLKPKPRPIVPLLMASSFNETIAMDLKSYNGVYFLVLVDLATM